MALSGSGAIRGDPAGVDELQRWFRNMADEVRARSDEIARLNTGYTWEGHGAAAFEQHLGNLTADMPRMWQSFDKAAWGLWVYEERLQELQAQARQAESHATDAHAQIQQVRNLRAAAQPGQDTSALDRTEQEASEQLQAAQQTLSRAVVEWDDAAKSCCGVLDEAEALGMRNSLGSWFDRHIEPTLAAGVTWVDDHLDDIAKWSTRIGAALDVIALVMAVTPLAPLAPVLALVAMGVQGVGLMADARLAAEGKEPWWQVGLDSLGVLAGGAGVLAGRAASKELGRAAEKLFVQRARYIQAADRGAGTRSLGGFKGWVTRSGRENQRLKDVVSVFREDPWKEIYLKGGISPLRGWSLRLDALNATWRSPMGWRYLPTSVRWARVSLVAHAADDVQKAADDVQKRRWGRQSQPVAAAQSGPLRAVPRTPLPATP